MEKAMSSVSGIVTNTSPTKAVNGSPGGSTFRPATFAETISQLENQILRLGSGPHTSQQKEELAKLNNFLQRTKAEQQKVMAASKHPGDNTMVLSSSPMVTVSPQSNLSSRPPTTGTANGVASGEGRVLDKRRLQELVKEVDPLEQLDDDVEEVMLQIADDFIDNVVTAACQIAKHRKSNTLEVKDVQLHLERNWNMWVPGFGSEEVRPLKKSTVTEAHKQRLALIRKTLKKY
ncbi:transcription initiation factor TFIID subunit 12-like [Gigantopelta aegis]|uniref:transcription initiation factor TFIID subunit 12-like n=1 Tax=Gigantopelta aegis TaxID=1735272 RepID=UPI001B88B436|nr:transcription initiation factor TFIID subunit 12-like [Gigantopelta aegis]